MTSDSNSRTAKFVSLTGLVLTVLGCGLLSATFGKSPLIATFRTLFLHLGAGLLVTSAGFAASGVDALALRVGPFQAFRPSARIVRFLPRPLSAVATPLLRLADRFAAIDWLGDWASIVATILLCSMAVLAGIEAWRREPFTPAISSGPPLLAILGAASFLVLVLERFCIVAGGSKSTQMPPLVGLLRVLLLTLLGLALSLALQWLAIPFYSIPERLVLALSILVALELTLRATRYVFIPLPPLQRRGSHAYSFVASLLGSKRPSWRSIRETMRAEFGIDLGRSWALSFIRRAAMPLLLGMITAAWLLSGVSTLGVRERAVYEAFGTPKAVFGPGLHVHLPWPFGRLQPVEFGVAHEISVALREVSDSHLDGAVKGTIEGEAPTGADRLWEASRPTEASYLVASNQNGQETFEVLNIDLHVTYRTGLSDEAALNAVYRLQSASDVVRVTASRILALHFARETLSHVLDQNREAFIHEFQAELQKEVSALSDSIDILAVIIETIHPPAGVATAYQQVQAAAIEAVTRVANARGDAARDVHEAEANATEARDAALAQAEETVADAKVGTALFVGDVEAYREGGAAFLFERRLAVLGGVMTPEKHVVIVDSRVPTSGAQMLESRAVQPPSVLPQN